jgi:hypothetical protein
MSQQIIERAESAVSVGGPAANSPMGMMLSAIQQGATLEQVEKMMDLQERWERKEAKKAYDAAFANFKAEAVQIIKGRKVTDGPLKNKSYAELHDVVDAVTPALSKHGLSSSWKLTKDDKDWMEVTCYLRHVGGHEESVSMGGPPDAGGAKNAIQARASTKTYLERYTLKGITGLSEKEDDTDGNAPTGDLRGPVMKDLLARVAEATDSDQVQKVWLSGLAVMKAAKDLNGAEELKSAVMQRKADMEGEANAAD